MDEASGGPETSNGKKNYTGENQRETLRPEPSIYFFTGKLNDSETEKYSEQKLRTTTVVHLKIYAFSHFLFH